MRYFIMVLALGLGALGLAAVALAGIKQVWHDVTADQILTVEEPQR